MQTVIKRSGSIEPFNLSKIQKVIHRACKGLNINSLELESTIQTVTNNGTKTEFIQNSLITAATSLITLESPDWNTVAGRLYIQQYRKNDTHDWHSHFGCLIHCVYFLELPDPKYATQIQTYDGKVIKPKVKEGDLLFLLTPNRHRSPINKSSKRKTIIAFNMNMIKTQDLPKGNKWETSIYE